MEMSNAVPDMVQQEFSNSILPDHTWMHVFIIGCFYLIGVLVLSSCKFKFENLRGIVCFYNMCMSLFSYWVFHRFMLAVWSNLEKENWDFSLIYIDPELKLGRGANTAWNAFYWSKHLEYVDTLWVILMGKLEANPRGILQVYHHWITPSIVYASIYAPGAFCWGGPLLNAFVHVVMYAYYCITYFFKDFRKYGKYVFYVQMTQFFICVVMNIVVTVTGSVSDWWGFEWVGLQYAVFICMFIKFYFFRSKEKSKEKQK